jgi:hypothetical protein
MPVLEAKTSRAYWGRIAILWALFAFIGLAISASARKPALGLLGIAIALAPSAMLWRRRATWVARLDDEGVTLRNGRRLSWSELEQVTDVHARRGAAEWHSHFELRFKRGRARVFDRMLANGDEVVGAIRAREKR